MTNHKKMLDREAVRSVIQQWNANRLDLFALSEPDENLLFHGVMRFYFQDAGQKVATKCIRVASDATVSDVIDTLIEKFRPDMRMLSVPNYALYEVHANGEERRLNPDEKPLLVQLNWHIDDREGRFLLKNIDQKTTPIETTDMNFKRKLSKREKKEQKKKEKLAKLNSDSTGNTENETHVAGKLYTELPETSFTRSISNPEAVMRRRRQQKLEKKLQQFRSRDGGPDTGGTLKIYGESLCQDVPYKTLLLSIRDCAQAVVREMLSKYGLDKTDPLHYCLVQVNCDGVEYILDDDECPLSILMNHPTSRGSIMFHVRRRPADSQPRRRKKKPLGASNGANSTSSDREGPVLVEVTHSGDGGRRIKLGSDPIEVGSANTNSLQLFGPSIQARHCLISLSEGVCTVTPLHADALTFVNGHHITQPTILHNGSVVMFGRVASYRFLDSPSDGRYNLALSQSQLDSACLYESRSPTSPASWNDEDGTISSNQKGEFETTSTHNNVGSGIISERTLNLTEDNKKVIPSRSTQEQFHTHAKETEINYDGAEPNVESETKSISSLKSSGSTNQDQRSQKTVSGLENQGQEPILPAVLEFPETHQENFLCQILTELDVNMPHFKLAPVYTLYLCARYRASTHYRPELQPTERAHKLTIFLHHVANLIYSVIQEQYGDPRILAFWMANSSEFLHFLKSDRHISAFSVQAQEILAESVQTAFRNLVNCFRVELSQTLNQFLSETIDHDSAAGLVLTVLGSAMALLRRCRVNAALTIQLFSQLFHYINVICFNTIVANSHMCTAEWGKILTDRLQLLELWAERQGLELAADSHLAKINQCAQFLQAPKTSVEEIQKLACSCFRLNSLQMSALLQQEKIPRTLIDTVIRMAESVADELTRADGRQVRLEESPELHLALLLPDDGFSCDVVRGIPSGLVDFLNPLQSAGMCRLAAQPTSIGMWTVYMHQFNARSPSAMSNKLPQPEVQVIKLHKNSNGMGLSIVAAKGAGQERLGIYIKSVVPGGAADADGRLQAGDQLLRVDGQSLIGITQEKAADYLVRTGPVVTLEVAKQGAIYHGLATLLQQPSPVIQRESEDLFPGRYYNSVSEESLNKYNSEPPIRRLSASSLQEELCQQGYQLHIDPRYRDTRPIARSSSSLYLPVENNSPIRNREPNPSIYIEEYNDDSNVESRSNDSFPNFSYSEAHQPLNEDGIASVADSDDIPFIDDGSPTEECKSYIPENEMSRISTSASDKTSISIGGGGGIMTSSQRRPTSGYRKTVSFDLVASNDIKKRNSVSLDRESSTFKRKSHTYDAISNFCKNSSSVESIDKQNFENVSIKINEPQQGQTHLEQKEPAAERKPKRELNTDRSTSGTRLNRSNIARRASSAICPSTVTIEVPSNAIKCSSEANYLPNRSHSHANIFLSPSIRLNDIGYISLRNFGEGKVREMADLFEQRRTRAQSETLFDFTQVMSRSNPDVSHKLVDGDPSKLTEVEQIEILKQLKEWSLYGSSGTDYIIDNSLKTDQVPQSPKPSNTTEINETLENPTTKCISDPTLCGDSDDIAVGINQNTLNDSTSGSSSCSTKQSSRRLSERDISRMGVVSKNVGPLTANSHLANSKSVPALHHSSNNVLNIANSKSRSTHSLANNNEQGFYQNLSVYRAQNQSQPIFGERPQIDSSNSAVNTYNGNLPNSIQQQTSSNPVSGILHPKNIAPPSSINQNNILNRPASAYYQSNVNANYATNTSNTTMPLSNPMLPFNDNHGISASSTNINANGNISSSNSQLHHMQPQSSLTVGNRPKSNHNFNREGQSQSSLRMNQIFAPSMPNIAAAHTTSASPNVYNGGMSSSQSMQNVTMITHAVNPAENLQQHGFTNGGHNHNQQFITKASASNHMVAGRAQPIVGDMSMRRNHRIDVMQDSSHQLSQMMLPPSSQQQEQHHPNAAALPPKPQGMMHNSSVQPVTSSKHQLPPNVPKSQPSRVPQSYQQQHNADETPPLPPTTTHPLFKATTQTSQGMNYVASTVDPPKGGYYPINASTAHQTNFMGTNPWEREEREKEHEMRREHIRHWRDQQIVELSNVTQRSPQQEEQLKTLVLERDFERRAQEVEEQEDESEPSFEKENYQEVVRLANQPSTIQTPVTNFRQTDIRIEQEESVESAITTAPVSDSQALYVQNYQIQQNQAPMTVQPKGILKNNRYDSSSSCITPSSPSKSHKSASFADERHLQTEHTISGLAKDVSHMNINFEINTNSMERLSSAEHPSQLSSNSMTTGSVPPPPPPERNSSYVVMSQQQQKIRNSASNLLKTTVPPSPEIHNQNNMTMYSNGSSNSKKSGFALTTSNNNNLPLKNLQTQSITDMHSPMSSSTGLSVPSNLLMLGRDNKRVSFHDEENNYVPSQMTTHANDQSYTSDQSELHTISENPHDFSSESTEMLQTPTTPDADMWNLTVQSTPGVIGAQEVYRDPRQRRLAEQQQKQQQRTSEAVPEKLSFKEKMKMFALESGEDQTPKDKLKISRAQRDIDAVH